jgi:hypothetical protein
MSAPMMPPPPALFSTTTVWPSTAPSFSASVRATMSVVPPGAKGTTSRTGLLGQAVWAEAIKGRASRPAACRLRTRIERRFMLMGTPDLDGGC